MTRDVNWPLVGFFLILTAFPVAALISELSAQCSPGVMAEIAKEKPSFGCFEFWLNRYQATLAAFIAAAVAFFVVRPVYRQLAEMNRQSAIQVMERAEIYARELEAERDAVRTFVNILFKAGELVTHYDDDNRERAFQNWHNALSGLHDEIRSFSRILVAAELRSTPEGPEALARTRVIEGLRRLDAASDKLHIAFVSQTSGVDPEYGEDYTPQQCAEAESVFRDAITQVDEAYRAYAAKHMDAVKTAWARRHKYAVTAFKD